MPALSFYARALPERLVVTVLAYQLMSDNPSRDKSYSCTYNMDMDRLRNDSLDLLHVLISDLFLTLISPVVRHPKIIAKTLFSRPRPPRDPGRGPVMPTGGAHRVIVSASGDSRAAGRTGHARRRERPERVTTPS